VKARRLSALTAALVLALAAAPVALSQAPVPAKPQTTSVDSEAPPGAPPHWLPNEQWVMQHWLPYDETRLYELLGLEREAVWRWLRDDTKGLDQLARRRGWEPAELARALVQPWEGTLKRPERIALLEQRALRTLTQGHLAQHVFFHSLHQNAVPDNARAIFGVRSRDQFTLLRRNELSPVQICRLNGISAEQAAQRAEQTLRDMAGRAVRRQVMPRSQAARLLRRQLLQLPRWLHQTRYNGPPPIVNPRASAATAANYSNNAVLSGDGRRVAWEAYEAAVATAKTRGEINVLGRTLGATAPAAAPAVVSRWPFGGRDPRSSYNPAINLDGTRVAFEAAPGNLNFAKRYGKMAIFVGDASRGVIDVVSPDSAGNEAPRTSYNPTISANGRRVAYESYATTEDAPASPQILVTDLPARTTRALRFAVDGLATVTEPRLSGDGRFLAFTGTLAGGGATQVFVHDIERGRTAPVSDGPGDAYEPELSADGRIVVFTRLVPGTRQSRVYARDMSTGTVALASPAASIAHEPAISADGRVIAFTARDVPGAPGSVYVRDLTTQSIELISRSDAGTPAAGSSGKPSISADGRRVTFTSDAWNLAADKCNAARGVFLRDRENNTTTLLSEGDGANRYLGPTKGSSTSGDMTVALLCA
jgi:Tol biopolymer transport system component